MTSLSLGRRDDEGETGFLLYGSDDFDGRRRGVVGRGRADASVEVLRHGWVDLVRHGRKTANHRGIQRGQR